MRGRQSKRLIIMNKFVSPMLELTRRLSALWPKKARAEHATKGRSSVDPSLPSEASKGHFELQTLLTLRPAGR
ncbi:MAG TPA: hypothetical protein DEF45_20895 [Rhodopirellula sp.]|nr:hypothetical protein [Rhodopirellula sp.]